MKYFVSYVYRDKNGYGFSYSVLERKSKMEDETDIVDIIDVIANTFVNLLFLYNLSVF